MGKKIIVEKYVQYPNQTRIVDCTLVEITGITI